MNDRARVRGEFTQTYAKLPDELLEEILTNTGPMVEFISQQFGELAGLRTNVRGALTANGLLRHAEDLPPSEPSTIAAIDGGSALERSAGVDVILAVAVGVEGLGRRQEWDATQYKSWQAAVRHSEWSSRLPRGAMGFMEIAVAAEAPHDIVVLDGSHLTHVITVNSLLVRGEPEIVEKANELVGECDLVAKFEELNRSQRVVAIPKYDSSSHLVAQLIGRPVLLDDKSSMSIVLQPGEFTVPQRVPDQPWRDLRIGVAATFPNQKALEDDLKEAISPLAKRELFFTYFKPAAWTPAYRLEIKPQVAGDDASLARVLRTLASQCVAPDIREPYPQFMADEMAKSVSDGLEAMRAALQIGLARSGELDLLQLIAHSYRTEVA